MAIWILTKQLFFFAQNTNKTKLNKNCHEFQLLQKAFAWRWTRTLCNYQNENVKSEMYFYAKTKKNSRDFSFSANCLANYDTMKWTMWNTCEIKKKKKK